jgi:predicted short-subunit dehydrogenase-like oxidoreductase (DUF2520 family)
VRIYVNDPIQRQELHAALLAARCLSVAVEDDALEVSHPAAHDEKEALIELTFFVRAWQAGRPEAQVELA